MVRRSATSESPGPLGEKSRARDVEHLATQASVRGRVVAVDTTIGPAAARRAR
ncbi:hypothetical protein [Actinoalloteichus fjordicus]|uniref:hypothetical protein n=1 Tax=Actinoalloteichus fjordicus TaxID=1612552 RepID=UPI0012FAA962|nr:hypothetical protein [Actinoalloteichus fjordicus]